MNLLDQVQNILGKGLSGLGISGQGQNPQDADQQAQTGSGPLGNLSSLLGPAALGGLAGALFTSKAARGVAGGALLAGTGAALWNKYINRMLESKEETGDGYASSDNDTLDVSPNPGQGSFGGNTAQPVADTVQTPRFAGQSSDQERAIRLVRAMVFAAKSDGHIDDKEQQAIYDSLQKLNIGTDAQALVQRALKEPLDPALIAEGVKNEQEALEVFTLSCAVLDVDHFMERRYLDALAQALTIPDDVKNDLDTQVHGK